jgi:hypothetical protein
MFWVGGDEKVKVLRTWSKTDLIDKAGNLKHRFLEAASSNLNDSHQVLFNFIPFELTSAIEVESLNHLDLARCQHLAERASRHYADRLQDLHTRLPELYAVAGTCQPFRLSGRRALLLLLHGQWSPTTPKKLTNGSRSGRPNTTIPTKAHLP